MVKIKKYKAQTGVTPKPNTLSGIRYNPTDFSRGFDALARVGQTTSNVGLNLLQQQETNKARKAQMESDQELQLIKTLDNQANDFYAIKTKLDRSNKLTTAMDLALNGNGNMMGLNGIKKEFQTTADYLNAEEGFANASLAVKTRVLATIDDDVVKQNFIEKFDNKTDAYAIDVMNSSFKTGLQQRTAAYKKEEADLLYTMEFGNPNEKIQAENRLLGLNGVKGIHEEAFEQAIINATPDVANYYTLGKVEYIKAKLMIAGDPQAYIDLAKGDADNYPFKNLSLEQRADLDISAEKALATINNKIESNKNAAINDNKKNFNDIKSDLKNGIMPVDGQQDLAMYKAVAEALGDTDTVNEIDDYLEMYATYNVALQMNPAELADELSEAIGKKNQMNASILAGQDQVDIDQEFGMTSGVPRELLLKIKALESVQAKMNTSLSTDSLRWGHTTGLIKLENIDWVNATEDEFNAWVNTRKGQNDLVMAKYGTKSNLITKEDQATLMNIWQNRETSNTDKIFLIKRLAAFDEKADDVFSEILYKGEGKNESKYFAHLAGLINSKGFDNTSSMLALDFFQGFEMRDNESVPSAQVMFGNEDVNRVAEARTEFNDVIGGSLHNVSSNFMETLFDMAQIIYVNRNKNSKSTRFADPEKKIFRSIVEELIGSTMIAKGNEMVKVGGVGEFNDQATFVPSWMETESFEKVITGLTQDEWDILLNDQIPEWKYGEKKGTFKLNGDIFNNDGDQPYLWVIDDGKYIVSFNQPWNNADPQYIGTSSANGSNGYFVLDLNLIKDKIISKYK